MRPNNNGAVVYRGPSRLDGQPITMVLTGLQTASDNAKTGDLIQSHIMPDLPGKPTTHKIGGQAKSVCGVGKHRCPLWDACYVNLRTQCAVKSCQDRNGYHGTDDKVSGRFLRLGAWGDPAAVPVSAWAPLLARAKRWVGYTHQWQNPRVAIRWLAGHCMASVEGVRLMRRAQKKGFRTFRVLREGEKITKSEVMCPAFTRGTQCHDCGLCNGKAGKSDRRKSIAIPAHGIHAAKA